MNLKWFQGLTSEQQVYMVNAGALNKSDLAKFLKSPNSPEDAFFQVANAARTKLEKHYRLFTPILLRKSLTVIEEFKEEINWEYAFHIIEQMTTRFGRNTIYSLDDGFGPVVKHFYNELGIQKVFNLNYAFTEEFLELFLQEGMLSSDNIKNLLEKEIISKKLYFKYIAKNELHASIFKDMYIEEDDFYDFFKKEKNFSKDPKAKEFITAANFPLTDRFTKEQVSIRYNRLKELDLLDYATFIKTCGFHFYNTVPEKIWHETLENNSNRVLLHMIDWAGYLDYSNYIFKIVNYAKEHFKTPERIEFWKGLENTRFINYVSGAYMAEIDNLIAELDKTAA